MALHYVESQQDYDSRYQLNVIHRGSISIPAVTQPNESVTSCLSTSQASRAESARPKFFQLFFQVRFEQCTRAPFKSFHQYRLWHSRASDIHRICASLCAVTSVS